MRSRKSFLVFLLLSSSSFLLSAVTFAADPGAISTPHQALVCHDTTCVSPTPGTINFAPTGTTAVVIDSVTGLSGYVWGNELGWIDLHPTGAGVSFANVATGLLTGKAWSQVSGWINFAPTGQSVTIDPVSGEFSGFAWTGGPYGGWIKFDCSDNDSCVKSTYGTTDDDDGNGGGGTSGYLPPTTRDVCPNLPGQQATLPSGYSVDAAGVCVQVYDVCPNLSGVQDQLPIGFTYDAIGACILAVVDYCPNIVGNQSTIPPAYTLSHTGNCISTAVDACPDQTGVQSSLSQCVGEDICSNILGVQQELPAGYTIAQGLCTLDSVDLCPNIADTQSMIPEGMVLEITGDCAQAPTDLCDNLGGYQRVVPSGFYRSGQSCFFGEAPVSEESAGQEVVAYSFIPSWLQIQALTLGSPMSYDFLDSIKPITLKLMQ